MHRPTSSLTLLFAAAAIALCAHSATAAREKNTPDVYVSEVTVPYVLDVDLRNVPHAPAWRPGDPLPVVPEGAFSEEAQPAVPGWRDPLVRPQEEGTSFDGSLLFAFDAHPSGNFSPPDTVAAAGPNHYITMVNASRFAIWDKDGNNVVPETDLATLWTGGASNCTSGDGDPIVRWDALADRWLMQEFDLTGNTLCIYISQTSNPVSGGWFAYEFSAPSFPDYPQYGVWQDAYYVTSFESPNLGLYAFDRDAMLAGAPATFQRFTVPQLNGTSPRVTRMLPIDFDGSTPPPVGQPGIFVRSVHATQDSSDPTTRLEMFELDPDFANPGNTTFTQLPDLFPAAFALLPCSPTVRDCVPQPGTSAKLDALFNRALRRLQYRNFGTHETLVTNQVVDAGGGIAGKRWWELRRTPVVEGGSWSIFQEGTYNPDSDYRFMGSIAMNGNGDIALGYSVSSSTTLPSIRVTARHDGDPAGQMTMNELEIVPGTGIFTANQRWGDYTDMSVDPSDDETFWYVNMILSPTGSRQVWAGKFSIDGIFADGFESGDTTHWDTTVP